MNLEQLVTSLEVLELIKSALFIGFFILATSYLMPKGIVAFVQWKESKVYSKLVTAITFCTAALFLLVYLLSSVIISHAECALGTR